MARFVFVSPPFMGHLGPMMTLASELVRRGHRVTFAGEQDAAARVERAGLACETVGRDSHPPGHLSGSETRMARVRGLIGLGPVIRDMARTTDMLARELPDVIEKVAADAVVVDQLEAAGGLAARALRLPYATIANALPIDRDGDAAPFFTPWRPPATRWERQRVQGAYRVSDWMMRELGDVIAAHARRFGIGELRTPADCLSPAVNIGQLAPELDVPPSRSRRLDVGPLRRNPPGEPPASKAGAGGRPRVYASLGTLFGGRADVFRAIDRACADLGLDLIIAHGGRLTGREFAPSSRTRLESWVDQREMLHAAALCMTHAGMNTALDAAAAGVPMVAIPIAFDQPGIAARIERAGLGVAVTPGPWLALRLGRAMRRVLDDPVFRERALSVGRRISRSGGVSRAADEVETLIRPAGAREA